MQISQKCHDRDEPLEVKWSTLPHGGLIHVHSYNSSLCHWYILWII